MGFQAAYDSAGERGIAIIVVFENASPAFVIQHRIADQGQKVDVNSEGGISLLNETRIRNCPWCGCLLERRYKKLWRQLIRPEIDTVHPYE